MATITFEIRDCQIKASPNCTKTFQRELKRGRPPVACYECRKAVKVVRTAASQPAQSNAEPASLTRQCPCGQSFDIKPGRGRKAEKCEDCRNAGTVYRTDADGMLETIRRDQIEREETERRIEAGRIRAANLFDRMQPLFEKKNRVVIVH